MKSPTVTKDNGMSAAGARNCGLCLFTFTYTMSLMHMNGNDPAKTKSAQWSMRTFFTDCKSTFMRMKKRVFNYIYLKAVY